MNSVHANCAITHWSAKQKIIKVALVAVFPILWLQSKNQKTITQKKFHEFWLIGRWGRMTFILN